MNKCNGCKHFGPNRFNKLPDGSETDDGKCWNEKVSLSVCLDHASGRGICPEYKKGKFAYDEQVIDE